MKNHAVLDKQFVWHPFTQSEGAPDPVCIVRGEGAFLFDDVGRKYLDMISSWWVNIHGHGHPKIAAAIAAQAAELEQVIFADFTHPPAVELASHLVKSLPLRAPGELSRVFFSDSGSSAVEIALKQAVQYWSNRGDGKRRRFIAFEGGYHGDTAGAMSVGRGSGFFASYRDLMFDAEFAPFPATFHGDEMVEAKERAALSKLEEILAATGEECAAIIMEPLAQGASGMRICRPEFVRAATRLAREAGALVIFDEVMTGFGRTGTFCAYEQCGVVPDILCLAKGLSGGFLPLAATVSAEKIYREFSGADFSRALAHGHSYTANPIACAAANASLSLFKTERTMEKISAVAASHRQAVLQWAQHPSAKNPRFLGTIAAIDIDMGETGYGSKASRDMKMFFLNRGFIVRPLGETVYLLPPYCIDEADLQSAYNAVGESLSAFGKSAMPLVA